MPIVYALIGVVLATGGAMQYSKSATSTEVVVPEEMVEEVVDVEERSITLASGMDRDAIVRHIAGVFAIDEAEQVKLYMTYRSMQWDAFNGAVVPHLISKYNLSEADREILLTHATEYLDKDTDILESLYEPGSYSFPVDVTHVALIEELLQALDSDEGIITKLDPHSERELLRYVQSKNELLPDLIPLPPQDVAIRADGGRTLLVFTTIYYNAGDGNLELRADPKTIGTLGDFDRDVFQRIYRDNGTYRDRSAGTFHWHNEHLHYHFSDFIEYKLEAVASTTVIAHDLAEKSTFCIRDVSKVELGGIPSTTAHYKICGRERQGVSVGWGDAYFSTYVDQNLDVTGIPSGEYTLSFIANPADRFDEVTKENNVASAHILYDADMKTVEVLGTTPEELPVFEHIHVEQEF